MTFSCNGRLVSKADKVMYTMHIFLLETPEQLSPEDSRSLQSQVEEELIGGLVTGDLLEDAKFYQDVAVELQIAYDTLQKRFDQQSRLMEEASGALHAAESQASQRQQELLEVQRDYEANVQQAIGEAVVEYHEQLAIAKKDWQLKDREHQQTVHKLQDQVCALELSLAGQTTLPSVRHTQEGADLRKEVFDYLPGTVNTRRGAAMYDTQDQAFSFRKHVWFGDRSQVPDLKSDTDSEDQSSVGQNVPQSSTPHCGAKPMNQTFDISHSPPMTGSPQDTAAIAAEVSVAAAAQAWKEFCRMRDPKITKFKGGYLADAELMFHSWRVDIEAHIQDRELHNKATIQLIKDMTLENACREVEFELDLCGGSQHTRICQYTLASPSKEAMKRPIYWQNSTAVARRQKSRRKLSLMNCKFLPGRSSAGSPISNMIWILP